MSGLPLNLLDATVQTNGQKEEKKQENIEKKEPIKSGEVYSPIKGKVIALNAVKDATFAGEYLGKGVAIEPEEGRVVAPFDGKVTVVMDTKHAVGMTSDNGIEVLIHVGMDTVQLKGVDSTNRVSSAKLADGATLIIKEKIMTHGKQRATTNFYVDLDQDGGIHFSNYAPKMDPVIVGHLFDRFYTVTTGSHSTGLGLSIARALTEELEGRIEAEYRKERLYIHVCFPADSRKPNEKGKETDDGKG